MTESLSDLLRRGADSAAVPRFDLGEVVAEAGRRRRRRRYVVAGTAAAALSAIVAASVLVAAISSRTQDPPPAGPPSPSISKTSGGEGARPMVYAVGRTVHVGDTSVQTDKPVAFIAPTDDGAVYQATLDRTLWFTDGTTTEVIGTSEWTAAPTSHRGVVTTGDSGSLVVWADAGRVTNGIPVDFVVYDTSRREEVARIPFTVPGSDEPMVLHVDEDQVYFNPDPSAPGCWAVDVDDIHPCRHPQLFRFDVAAGETTQIPLSELHGALDARARMFKAVTQDGRVVYGGPAFALVGNRLVASIHDSVADDDAAPVTLADGSELRLRLPTGYVPPWPADGEGTVAVSQWLDDTHVALFADDGGGDLPAKAGDLLTCELPESVCQVTVPRSSQPYVAPYLG
jgi:hypothetical protein